MFASPLKQSTNGRRMLNVQEISQNDYQELSHKPSLQAGTKSIPHTGVILPTPINKEDFEMEVKKPVSRPSLPPQRKPLEQIYP